MTKKKKIYIYEQQWSDRTGEIKDRPLTKSRQTSGDYEEISVSRDIPKIRKEKQKLYDLGIIGLGDKTGGEWIDAVEWGKQGGRPRKWQNEAERQRVTRVVKKIKTKQTLKPKDYDLVQKFNLSLNLTVSDYDPSNPRPGAWTYHPDRAANSTERTRRWRGKPV